MSGVDRRNRVVVVATEVRSTPQSSFHLHRGPGIGSQKLNGLRRRAFEPSPEVSLYFSWRSIRTGGHTASASAVSDDRDSGSIEVA